MTLTGPAHQKSWLQQVSTSSLALRLQTIAAVHSVGRSWMAGSLMMIHG